MTIQYHHFLILDFLMNSNNNTIKNKFNKTEQPFSEKYLKNLNIMNAI